MPVISLFITQSHPPQPPIEYQKLLIVQVLVLTCSVRSWLHLRGLFTVFSSCYLEIVTLLLLSVSFNISYYCDGYWCCGGLELVWWTRLTWIAINFCLFSSEFYVFFCRHFLSVFWSLFYVSVGYMTPRTSRTVINEASWWRWCCCIDSSSNMRVRGSQATRNACSDTVSNGIALGGRNKL